MKKRILSAVTAFMLGLTLAGCALPGLKQTDDDFYNGDLDYNEAEKADDSIINYAWSIKPSISAENMIVFDGSQVDPNDLYYNDMYQRVAVICQNGLYGFMDYKGNLLAQPKFKYYMIDPSGQIVLYNVTGEKNDVREYCTMDKDGHMTDVYNPRSSVKVKYYYDADSKKTYVTKESNDWQASVYTEKNTVVAEKADVSEAFGRIEVIESEPEEKRYGLVSDNKVLLDFEYTSFYAPTFKKPEDTAIAFEKDGKWGYFDENGEQLIDFNCDAVYSSYNGELSDSIESGHPYLYSEDFIAVSINYTFGYYNSEGKCLVRSNEFSQARPVHRGKAWVCVGGLWGVIRFGEEEEDEVPVTTTPTTTTASPWTSSEEDSSMDDEYWDPDWGDPDWVDPDYQDPWLEDPWVDDPSYDPGYDDPGYGDGPAYDPGNGDDPGYVDPGYGDEPGYVDPGYVEPDYGY